MEENNREDIQEKIIQLTDEVAMLKSRLLEQKCIEEQLRQAQKMEALTALSTGVAHDFNNLLQSILSYTQLAMIKENGSNQNHQLFLEIGKIVTKGAELTKKFITYGNKSDYRTVSLYINENIMGVEKLLKRTLPKNIAISTKLSQDIKRVNADSNQIDQVIMNICINARDSMPDGGNISITTENIRYPNTGTSASKNIPQGEYVLVTISYTVSDLSSKPDEDQTPSSAVGSSGLGLSMVYSIINDFAGHMDFTEQNEQDGIFKIYLPIISSPAPEPETVHIIPGREDTGENRSVLLVDDEPQILNLGKKTLEMYGYNVTTAFSGEKAIEHYTDKKADIVLLDIGMPGMGGFECINRLKAIDPEVKILVMSGYSSKEHQNNAIDAGASIFLSKPYTISEMVSAVRDVLN